MKNLMKLGLACWLLSCSALVTSVSGAQNDTPDSPNAQEARRLMEEGAVAVEKGDLDAARKAFVKSLDLYESYDVACNLGIVEFELKRYLEAAENLDLCLRTFATGENRQLLETVKAKWKETLNYVGAAEIAVSHDGAAITIDGEPIGTSPIGHRIFLMAGEHSVRAEGTAGTAEQTFVAEKQKITEIVLELRPEVSSGLDEEEVPGAALTDPGLEDESPRRKRDWVPAYVLGGATVAALGTSMVFRILAGNSKQNAEDLGEGLPDDGCAGGGSSSACGDIENHMSALKTRATVSNAALIGTAVLGAATVGYVAYQLGKSPRRASVSARAAFGPTGGSLTITGQF